MVHRAAVAVRIRLVREDLALTQPAFADALGVTTRAVQWWEAGRRTPTMASLRKLETLSGRKPIWFLHGAGDDPLNKTVDQLLDAA